MYIDGYAEDLPHPEEPHGFSINEFPPSGGDCDSTGSHYNPLSLAHGDMNSWPSHGGDLDPLLADANGDVNIWQNYAYFASLYGSYAIPDRSLCVYETYGED